MLAVRAVFAVAAMAVMVWLLLSGQPFGALVVVLAAIFLRRTVESGRLARFANRIAKPS